MEVRAFEWDEHNAFHISEHGVAIFEVEEGLLFHTPRYQRGREDTYVAYTVTGEGRYLFIVFVLKPAGRIRVITARDMTDKEKRSYKQRGGRAS
jgi:uncharacterized DUF497 family protein